MPAHCRFFAGRQGKIELKIELKIEPKKRAADAPCHLRLAQAEPVIDSGVALHRHFRA